MKKKVNDQISSEFFEEVRLLREQYKALKGTVKNIRKFTERKFSGGAEC